METFLDRLKLIIKDQADGKHTVFAKNVGIPVGSFQYYMKGNIPKPGHLIRIFETYGVNITWLLTGKGEKYLSNDHKDTPFNFVELGHINFDNTFKNKTLAIEIAQILKKIEDLDETHLREIKGLLRAELSQLRNRPDRRSGDDRRKEDIPELTPEDERRSGNERRVAGLNG